jgi:hypothetical protein
LQQQRRPGRRAGTRGVAVVRPFGVDDSLTKPLADHFRRGPGRDRGGCTTCHADAENDKQVAKAKADLDAYRTSFGQLINSVVPELPADAGGEELIPHVDSLITAIDASVAGKPDYQSKLSMAAQHMPMTAAVLTSGIVANKKIES